MTSPLVFGVLELQILIASISLSALIWACIGLWQGHLQRLPTLGWALFICLPLAFEAPLINEPSLSLRLWSAFVVLAGFFTGDAYISRKRAVLPVEAVSPHPQALSVRVGYILAGLFVAISAHHLITAPDIPFITGLTKNLNEWDLADHRHAFGRIQDGTSPVVAYMRASSILLLACPALLLLIRAKKWGIMAALGAWTIFYAIAGNTKLQIILVLSSVPIGLWLMGAKASWLPVLRAGVIAGLTGITLLFALSFWGPKGTTLSDLNSFYVQGPQTPSVLLGDRHRAQPKEEDARLPLFVRGTDYLLLRSFFVPAEISVKWFEYFTQYPTQAPLLSRTIEDSRLNKRLQPSRAVGIWALHERYPHRYSRVVNAYASFDADAFMRRGLAGVIGFTCMLLLLRFALWRLDDKAQITGGSMGAVGLLCLFFLPAYASLPAILVSSGFLGILCVMLAQKIIPLSIQKRVLLYKDA